MTIVPKKENNPNDASKGSNTSSYVMDPGFFKREMAKKGYIIFHFYIEYFRAYFKIVHNLGFMFTT